MCVVRDGEPRPPRLLLQKRGEEEGDLQREHLLDELEEHLVGRGEDLCGGGRG